MKEKMNDLKNSMVYMARTTPEEFKKFNEFISSVLKDGKLDLKTKELICVGIAVASRCDYCIGLHVEKAFKAGASEEEIVEAGTVAILMGGGPAFTYMTVLKKAIDYYRENH